MGASMRARLVPPARGHLSPPRAVRPAGLAHGNVRFPLGRSRRLFSLMALTPDQQATLQLLLVRGQRYGDLAALLNVEETEVRRRARSALVELGGADPDRNVGLTDYLLGQADPIGRADASRHLREHADDRALVTIIAERLREMFPGAELPRLPGEPRPPRTRLRRGQRSGASSDATAAAAREPRLSQPQTRLIVILGAAAVLLVAVVLGITGAFGGDDEGSSASATTTETTPADESAVPIQLTAEKGSDAGGVVVFGFATADQPFIEFQIRNLEPAPNGKAYVLWFLTGNDGYPLPQQLPVAPNGTLNQRLAVPAEILAFVQQADAIAIALNDTATLDRDIREAVEGGRGALRYPGGTVLSAAITRGTAGAEGG